MNRGTRWKKLTRGDLSNFDDFATDVVLTAMNHGAIGRVSGRGHVFIRAASGGTMSVTRDTSAPHTAQNIRADLRRLFPETKQNGTLKRNQAMQIEKSDSGVAAPPTPMALVPDELLPCPAKGCEKEFATQGALYGHVRDDHATCSWEGPDFEHDNPSYRCDLGPNGQAFVGMNQMSIAGHVNIQHKGNKPWEKRDPAKRSQSAKKGAATRAANKRATKRTEIDHTVPAHGVSSVAQEKPVEIRNVGGTKPDKSSVEHRGLPAGEVKHKPMTPAAKLAAIRELLGEDPRVAQLQAEVDELKAQLELVAEVLHLAPTTVKKNK